MMTIEVPVGARVVVAEDDAIVAADLRESLEGMGYEVPAVVGSGKDAVEAARAHTPDVVLMDVRMPGTMDGVEAARRISDELTIPVVYLSGYSDDVTVARAKQTHPFGYLVKPFDPRELKTAVEIAVYRHHAERMVEESRERYRRLFHHDIAGNFVTTPDGKILNCNQAFARILGCDTVDECLGTDAEEFYPEGGAREEFVQQVRTAGEVRNRRGTLIRKDGEPVRVLENARGEFDERGRLSEIHGHLVDVTREERVQEQLRLSSRMEAVGRLAAGVAHDFNNFLTAIRGAIELTVGNEALDDESRNDLKGALRTCDRAAGIVKQLLTAAGQGETTRRLLDVSGLVSEMGGMLERLMGERAVLEFEASEGPIWVHGNPSKLEQVVLNLVVNARDALEEQGSGTIRVAVDIVSPDRSPRDDGKAGRRALLSVSDDGQGMTEEVRQRIFDPFYTTKGPGRGTGLGLASTFGIVRDHGGWIDVESEPGEGSTFKVYLPLAEEMSLSGPE